MTELPPTDAPPPLVRPWDAPPGERDNPIARTRAPADSDSRDRQAPAPDSGLAGGAPLDHAFRLDRSTLRSRLTDGAAEAQPARLRISRRHASPQAIRREPTVGIGDSVRTVVPSRAPISPANAAADPALGGEPAGAALAAAPATLSDAPPLVARVDPDPTRRARGRRAGRRGGPAHLRHPAAGAGGRQSHPADGLGRASPRDHRFFARGGAAADRARRGAGAVRRARARCRVRRQAPRPQSSAPAIRGSSVGTSTSGRIDRRYDRYIEEIRQRVRRIREFPRSLAVRLLEGETIVVFVVDVNGRLGDGPRVIKSSGFEEFDAAAVRAVRRAAPFPPMPDAATARPLSVSLRVIFDNPVVR